MRAVFEVRHKSNQHTEGSGEGRAAEQAASRQTPVGGSKRRGGRRRLTDEADGNDEQKDGGDDVTARGTSSKGGKVSIRGPTDERSGRDELGLAASCCAGLRACRGLGQSRTNPKDGMASEL